MLPPSIPEPSSITLDEPDKDTKKGLDWTNPAGAHGRVFYMNLRVFHYGTDDKTHAASIFLSMLISVVLVVVTIIEVSAKSVPILDHIVSALISAFSLTVGIAVGKSSSGDKDS